MSLRPSQQTLRLDGAAADQSNLWWDGTALNFLGQTLHIRLDGSRASAHRVDATVHLPLPPQAGARQIQDLAEAWLRREAQTLFTALLARLASERGITAPSLRLSFAARSPGARIDTAGGACKVRCNWRLIEQPLAVIEHALRRCIDDLAAQRVTADLFAALAA